MSLLLQWKIPQSKFSFPYHIYGESCISIWYDEGFPLILLWFPISSRLPYWSWHLLLKQNHKNNCNLWGSEEALRKRGSSYCFSPPPSCFVNPCSPRYSVWCHTRGDQWKHLDIPVFLPLLRPFPRSLIYLRPLHSAECTMCCHRASRQCTETQPEREGEKGKVWVDFTADLEAVIWHAPAIPAPVISQVSHRPPSSFSLLPLPLFVSVCFSRQESTTYRIQEANAAVCLKQDQAVLTIKMGCTTGHLACQTQSQTNSGQESQSLEAGSAKVPEVLSSLERLSQATGGMEKSWYRCIFPFGIISLVIGVAGTGVTYSYNDLPQTKVVSVVLLVMGLLLLLVATVCWTVHKKKRKKKKEGGSFNSEQCPLWG